MNRPSKQTRYVARPETYITADEAARAAIEHESDFNPAIVAYLMQKQSYRNHPGIQSWA